MDTLTCIAARHSYRGKYLSEPVPREDRRKILEAGLAAPSGCNKQTARLIAVDDPELLARLKAAIDEQKKLIREQKRVINELKNELNIDE